MLDGEGLKPTGHQKICVLDGGSYRFEQVQSWLDELSSLVEAKNVHGLIAALKSVVPEYTPSEEMLSLSEVDESRRYKQGIGRSARRAPGIRALSKFRGWEPPMPSRWHVILLNPLFNYIKGVEPGRNRK